MKKPFSTSSAFAFLFVMAAVTPQSVWASNKCEFNGRSPASDEQINCLKEEKDRLEKDMKKLVEDKEQILKELEELKSSKKDGDKAEKKDSKKQVTAENREQEMADMMGQFTYMMLSQQQQQQALMNQMFSFMTQTMLEFSYSTPYTAYGTSYPSERYALHQGMGMGLYYNDPYSMRSDVNPYAQEYPGAGIGIGLSQYGHSEYQNPYAKNEDYIKVPYRYPAQIPNQLERSQLIAPPPVSGYDFNPAVPMQSQQQQPQLQEPVYRPQQMDRKPPLEA